jgi:hypothetical protein
MGKTLQQKMTRAVFAVTFSGEIADPVFKIKIYSRLNEEK